MYYYIQSGEANEWMSPLQCQTDALNECRKTKQNIQFTITDPVGKKSFPTMCTFHGDHCKFYNKSTCMLRKVIWNEKALTDFPKHCGAQPLD